jgi:superfamily II DNA/RNA helicase
MSFATLGVPADLVAALGARDITQPFPIQAATIADVLAGRDVCGKAPTGSGKTLAFGVPLVARVPKARPRRPRALVLAPTRELAAQIQKDLQPLAAVRDLRVFSVYGGVGYEPQKRALRNGVEVLVACPGRLEDLIDQRAVRLDAVEIVVLDEADRMADMGFLPAVRRILDQTAEVRQTVLFSATLDGDVAVLTRDYQQSPIRHEVQVPEDDWASAEHVFEDLTPDSRLDRTAAVVADAGPTIVFTHTRRGADRVAKRLAAAGVSAAPIHGGLSQVKRDQALRAFRDGKVRALVATDVAARGIHVEAVACVVHFDPPVDSKTYVHRSGRTARAGASGRVVSFVTGDQRKASLKMRRELGLSGAERTTAHAHSSHKARANDFDRAGRNRNQSRPADAGARTRGGADGERRPRDEKPGRTGDDRRRVEQGAAARTTSDRERGKAERGKRAAAPSADGGSRGEATGRDQPRRGRAAARSRGRQRRPAR